VPPVIGSLIPTWTHHTLEVLTAVGTVGAVIVAVFGALSRAVWRSLREKRTRPVVRLDYEPETGLQEEALVTVISGPGGTVQSLPRPAAFARLRVINKIGHRAAEGVQVLLSSPEPIEKAAVIADDKWRSRTVWSVGALGWTHADPPDLTIGPGAMRTVDLGRIEGAGDPFFTLGLPDAQRPASGIDRMPAGRYRLTLLVVGHNFDATLWELHLDYDGAWTPHATPPAASLKITNPTRV
jgi:hypothetical protein